MKWLPRQLIRLARRLEKRASFKDEDGWFYDWLTSGGKSASGEAVSPTTALTLSAYFAAVRNISEDVAKTPLILYRRLASDGKERYVANPLYRVLHDRPNPYMTAMAFWEKLTSDALSWGNGYAEIEWKPNEHAGNLWWRPPEHIEPKIEEGQLLYMYREGGVSRSILPRDMLHIHGLGDDGLRGYSIARLAREAIGTGLAMERQAGAFFGNAARPSGLLETDEGMTPEARKEYAEQFSAWTSGENAHKTPVLAGGLKFRPVTVSNEDAQWIDARNLTVEEMARITRIPPHKIAQLLRSTFANIEHQAIEYVTDCLLSWYTRIAQEVNRKLIPIRMQGEVFSEHLIEYLLRADTKSRYEAYNLSLGASGPGWRNVNEVRIAENLNPIEGGNTFFVPGNLLTLDRAIKGVPTNGAVDPGNGGGNSEPPDNEADEDEGRPAGESDRRMEILAEFDRRNLERSNGYNGAKHGAPAGGG